MPGEKHLMWNVRKWKKWKRRIRERGGQNDLYHYSSRWKKPESELNVPFFSLHQPISYSHAPLPHAVNAELLGLPCNRMAVLLGQSSRTARWNSTHLFPFSLALHPSSQSSPLLRPGWSGLLLWTALHNCLKRERRDGGHKCKVRMEPRFCQKK